MMNIDGKRDQRTEDILSRLCNDNGVSYLAPSPQESEETARIRRERLEELMTRFIHFETCAAACPDYLHSFFVNLLVEVILWPRLVFKVMTFKLLRLSWRSSVTHIL